MCRARRSVAAERRDDEKVKSAPHSRRKKKHARLRGVNIKTQSPSRRAVILPPKAPGVRLTARTTAVGHYATKGQREGGAGFRSAGFGFSRRSFAETSAGGRAGAGAAVRPCLRASSFTTPTQVQRAMRRVVVSRRAARRKGALVASGRREARAQYGGARRGSAARRPGGTAVRRLGSARLGAAARRRCGGAAR